MRLLKRSRVPAAFLFSLFLAFSASSQAIFHEAPLTVETREGDVSFQIEVADDPDERSRGLMFRRSMPEDAGMLFVHDAPREITMWMKNTYIPLDMIFIGAEGKVVSVAADTIPHSLSVISSRVDARYVLELNAGMAKRHAIRPGDAVEHPAIQRN
ncbi:MAG: DUF192 domain-containing protein [Pseudomonadota bacterium]